MRSKPRRFAITWETGSGYRSRGACNFRQAGKVISRYTENTRAHRPTRFVANPAVCKRAQTLAHASNVGWVIRGRILGGSFTREQAYSAFFPPTYRSLPPAFLTRANVFTANVGISRRNFAKYRALRYRDNFARVNFGIRGEEMSRDGVAVTFLVESATNPGQTFSKNLFKRVQTSFIFNCGRKKNWFAIKFLTKNYLSCYNTFLNNEWLGISYDLWLCHERTTMQFTKGMGVPLLKKKKKKLHSISTL